VGPLPEAVQRVTTFSAGVAVKSNAADAAKALIEFLKSPAVAPAIAKTGLEPIAQHAH
jgi:molybdate transport system substrate-binding protein